MQIASILRVMGILFMVFSLSMVPPYLFQDSEKGIFFRVFIATFSSGSLLWVCFRSYKEELKVKEGFFLVALFWIGLSFFASLPFLLSPTLQKTFIDSLFETVSGLTTTGASILKDINHIPRSIAFYRQELQFLGGMGIVLLAVAILPMLGVGGMQLYRAEISGPVKDKKLTPRIKETAKNLWYLYVGLTLLCALAYWSLGQMTPLDALGESFGTLSTGGFSMHNDLGFYENPWVYPIAMVFMLLGSTSFSLHFYFFTHKKKGYLRYWKDQECRAYLIILLMATGIVSITLWNHNLYSFKTALGKAFFAVISLGSTTGFVSEDFQSWPTFVPCLLMLIALIGGCATSTSGGIKVIRILVLWKQITKEMTRLIHPKAILPSKLGNQLISSQVIETTWAFMGAFMLLFFLLVLILMGLGLELQKTISLLVACLGNSGVIFSASPEVFASLKTAAKYVLIFAMLAGRLEIFTLLLLFTPRFWRY